MRWYSLILLWTIVSPISAKKQLTITDSSSNSTTVADPRAQIDTLRLVHAIWRHGDRTPSVLLPNDQVNNKASWKIGLGELTDLGIQQEYRLGQWLRKRYGQFLSAEYDPHEIYIRSSDLNRTLMSAQALFTGFYAPQKQQNDSSPIQSSSPLWRPVPVHTVQQENDQLLCMWLNCPMAEAEQKRIYQTQAVRMIAEKNAKILNYISEMTNSSVTFDGIWNVFDPLNAISNHPHTHKFPEWVNTSVWEDIKRLYHISTSYKYQSDLLRRLRGGILLEAILTHLRNVPEVNSLNSRKFFGYSAHDLTLAAFLSTLGVRLDRFPPYAALLLLETHLINKQLIVKLFYKNVTDSEKLYSLPIIICNSTPCTVSALIEASQRYIPNDWQYECGNRLWYHRMFDLGLSIVPLIIISFLVGALSTLFLIRLYERRNLYSDRILVSTMNDDFDSCSLESELDDGRSPICQPIS